MYIGYRVHITYIHIKHRVEEYINTCECPTGPLNHHQPCIKRPAACPLCAVAQCLRSRRSLPVCASDRQALRALQAHGSADQVIDRWRPPVEASLHLLGRHHTGQLCGGILPQWVVLPLRLQVAEVETAAPVREGAGEEHAGGLMPRLLPLRGPPARALRSPSHLVQGACLWGLRCLSTIKL